MSNSKTNDGIDEWLQNFSQSKIIRKVIYSQCFLSYDESARESERRHQLASRRYHPKRRIKREYLAVTRFFLPSNLLLPSTVYRRAGLEVGTPNNTRPTTDEPLMVTAMRIQGKEHDGNRELCGTQQDAERIYTKIPMKNFDVVKWRGTSDEVRLLNILMQLRKCINHLCLFDGTGPGFPHHYRLPPGGLFHIIELVKIGQQCHPARWANG